MAFTATTLSTACAATDVQISVAAATNFAANQYVKIDEEFMKIASSYTSGTIIPVSRGQNGTVVAAHVITANVVTAPISSTAVSDWTGPSASTIVSYPLSARRRKVVSYTTAGAISLPVAGEDLVVILNSTVALAMTLAVPTKDLDGTIIWVGGNGAAAHTIQFTGGLSGAGSSYDIITVNATAPIVVSAMAINGLWNAIAAIPVAGTVTNVTGTLT